ncbi:MAG: phenylacetate--CoA ligase family protein [Myxococcales bacterium]|nr:phenylacetate--CoA ligase family protein [Myxococcales bacterium]
MLSLLHSSYWVGNAAATQYLPAPAFKALQLARLKSILAYAWKEVPLYRELWAKAGVDPSSIQSLSDLAKLPIPNRKSIEENPRDIVARRYLHVFDEGTGYIRMSGGSSGGKQLLVHSDPDSWTRLDGFYYRAFGALGYRPWTPLVYFWSAPFKRRTHNVLGIMPKIGVPAHLDEESQLLLLEQNPGAWWYYHPTSLFPLVRMFPERMRATAPDRVIVHAELCTQSMKATIEDVMQRPVYDQYGTSEYNRMAWQCSAHQGYHVDADSVIMELLDDDNRPVKPGEIGRAVVTGLINRMMPLIRYELGDLLVASDRRCSCGRTLPMIERVEGRMKDVLTLPGGGRRTPREQLEPFGRIAGLDLFRLTINAPDRAELDIVTRESDTSAIEAECRKRFGEACPGVRLDVKRVDTIEKAPTGKRVLLRNRINMSSAGARPVFTA